MMRFGQLEQVVDLPELGISAAGSLFVVHIRQAVTAASLDRMEAAHADLRGRLGQKLDMLTIAHAGTPLPEGDVKVASARSYRTLSTENVCAATVVSGVGFWASAARSTLTGLALLARPGCPTKTFGDVSSALLWMEALSKGPKGHLVGLAFEVEQWKEASTGALAQHP
jgi:hypothetical protein